MTITTSGLTLVRRLGAGGEAEVFEVAERPRSAYKRFRQPTAARADKLRVMLDHPPEIVDVARSGGHVAIAWPDELVLGDGRRVDGFLMPRIDLGVTVPVFQVYNPSSRVKIAPAFTWRYLLRTARNIAAIVDSLHRAGYVVGDINESNFLVNRRALAVLVDCDSMQVRDPATGAVHRGGVGKPEFTAPEFEGRNLASVDRTAESDDFALAILVFQLLMEGLHPFAGIWSGGGEPPDVPERMRAGRFPYRRGGRLAPPPHALGLDVLPPDVRRLVWQTFTAGVRRPSARPTAAQWAEALERADAALTTCERSPHHAFTSDRRRCPWCDRIDAGLPDPFPGPTGRSSLEPRPPPRLDRWKAVAATAARAVAHRMWRWSRRWALREARWVWSKVGKPLAGPVPAAIVFAALGALVPLAGVLLFCVRSGALPALKRTQIPWPRIGIDAAAVIAVTAVVSFALHDGAPPLDLAVATATGLLAFCARFGVHTGPVSAQMRHTVTLWTAALVGVVALAVLGPQWWPSA